MHLDVGVDEHDDLVAGAAGARVARLDRGALPRAVDDDHLVVGTARSLDGATQRSRVAGRFVAGITTERGSIGGDYSVNRT